MFRRFWGSPRARGLALAVVIASSIAAAGGGAAFAYADAQRQEDAAALATARSTAVDARKDAAEVRRLEQLASSRLSEQLTALSALNLDQLATLVDARDVDALRAAIAAAGPELEETDARVPAKVAQIPEQGGAVDELEAIAAAWDAEQLELEQLHSRIRRLQVDVDVALDAIANAAPAAAEAVLNSTPLAGDAPRAAVTESAAAIATATEKAAAIGAFLDAVNAAQAAHAAEEARLTAEAEASAGAGGSSRGTGGNRGGGSSGGGGGAPSTGGGSSGGGTTPPQDTRRYADPRGPYTPGCTLAGLLYSHDPGPGGTSIINSVNSPYDYRIEGNFVSVYGCSSW